MMKRRSLLSKQVCSKLNYKCKVQQENRYVYKFEDQDDTYDEMRRPSRMNRQKATVNIFMRNTISSVSD